MNNPSVKSLVSTIRKDPHLGRDSMSYIDETYTDGELGFLVKGVIRGLQRAGKSITGDSVLAEVTWIENLWRENDAEKFAASSDTLTSADFPFKQIKRTSSKPTLRTQVRARKDASGYEFEEVSSPQTPGEEYHNQLLSTWADYLGVWPEGRT